MGRRHFRDIMRDTNPEFDEEEITQVSGSANIQEAMAKRIDDLSAGFLYLATEVRSHSRKLDDRPLCREHAAMTRALRSQGDLLEDLAQQARTSYDELQRTIRHAAVRENRVKSLEDEKKSRKANRIAVWLAFGVFFLGCIGGASKILWDTSQIAAVVNSNHTEVNAAKIHREKLSMMDFDLKDKVISNQRSVSDHEKRLTMMEETSSKVVENVTKLQGFHERRRIR